MTSKKAKMTKKYIATRQALCGLVLLVGILSVYIQSYVFPFLATALVFILVTDWKRVFHQKQRKVK